MLSHLDPRERAFLGRAAVATWGDTAGGALAAHASSIVPAGSGAEAGVSIHDLETVAEPVSRLAEQAAACSQLYVAVVAHNEFPLASEHRAQLRAESFPDRVGDLYRIEARAVPDADAESLLVVYASPSYLETRYAPGDPHEAEREKWDAVYAQAPPLEAHSTPGFNDELAACVEELLEPGDSVLEAGCGQGNGSLAIARKDLFSVSLLDFSENALRYAKALFERDGLQAKSYIHDDMFAPKLTDRFDLVFNAGSLEHYTFDEQVAFLRGMASLSKRYVLVLWPNRECYWYWIWRMRAAAASAWAFGKEVPSTDMDAAIRAAGLHPVGHRPFGVASTANIIMRLGGLSEDLRRDLLAIHDSPVLPLRHRAYLVAALASVEPGVTAPSPAWTDPVHDEMPMAELTAALADAMSMTIATQRANAALEKARARATAETDKVRTELQQQRRRLQQAEQRLARVERSRLWRARSRLSRVLRRARV